MPNAYGVTTPYAWYKTSTLSLNNNDAVATWTDSSGNARDATQGTSGLRPTYISNAYGGSAAVRFASATGHYLAATGVSTALRPVTLVAKLLPSSTGIRTVQGASGGNGCQWRFNAGKSELLYQSVASLGEATAAVSATVPSVALITYNTDSVLNHYTDNVANGTSTTNATFATSSLLLGSHGSLSEYFDGDIFEFLVFDRILDATERTNIYNGMNGPTFARTIQRLVSTHTG